MLKKALNILAIISLMMLTAGCEQKVEQPETLEKLTLSVEASLLPSAVWVAEKKGYLTQAGLDVDIREYDSGRLSFVAMLNRDEGINISTVAPTPIMFNSFERADFSIFATFVYSYEDMKIIARKDKGIATASDLVGKKIGTPAGTTGQFFTEAFLVYNGISSEDVDVVDIAPSALPEALNTNIVDAVSIWKPHGYNTVLLLGDKAVRLPSLDVYKEMSNFMVMNDFAETHPGRIEKFLAAIAKATDFIKNNKSEAQAIVVERLGLDPKVTTALWDDFIFELSLDQLLLITLEDEARWAIQSNLVTGNQPPNYLNHIYTHALKTIQSDAMTLMTESIPAVKASENLQ